MGKVTLVQEEWKKNFAGFFLLTIVQEEWKKNFAGFFLLVDGYLRSEIDHFNFF